MNIIIYFINNEFFKINLDKAARFNVTRVTLYFNKLKTYVCKQRTNNQCRTYKQGFINLSFSLRVHKTR